MLKNLLHQVLRRRAPAAATPPAAPGSGLEAVRRRLAERDLGGAERALDALSDAPAAESHWLRGELARRRGDFSAAERCYRSALRLDPHHRESWMSLGVLCYRSGRLALAHQYFRAALEVRSGDPEALNELGLVELAQGNRTEARSTFEQALDCDPGHAQAWNNLGLTLAGQGSLREACRAFRRALALKPNHLAACANLGLVLRDLNRPEEACEAFRTAREIDPDAAGVRVGLALALQDLGDLSAARAELEQALAAAPEDVDALSALGALLLRLGLPAESRRCLERALALAPADAEARLAMAHLLLAQGHYRDGWDYYEARLASRASPRGTYAIPHWQGAEPPIGRRLLVYGEQGLGEQIMFASMLDDIAGDADVTLDCEPRLRSLFERSFERVRILERRAEPLAASGARFDACIPVGSLARWYRRDERDFPRHAGYLKPDPARVAEWRRQMAQWAPGRRIGIAWKGGLASTGRALRSLELPEIARWAARQPAVWVSLQHDARAEELDGFRAHAPLHHDGTALRDIDDTAALVASLDLVIAPCSTVVHMAGALGRPVWVLTSFAPAWRYRLQGEGMPWYPSARLFRQPARGAWAPVLESVADALAATMPGRTGA